HHRVVRGRRGRRHGQPARRRHLRAPDRPDRRPHDVLRAEAGRDHRLRFHGARAAVPAQRSARRGGVARMKRRAAAWVRRHAVLGGAVVGFFCLRRRGIYFAMLTLAFAQLLYFVGFHLADWTGGDDGLRGIAVPAIGLGSWRLPPDRSVVFYYFTLVIVGLAV